MGTDRVRRAGAGSTRDWRDENARKKKASPGTVPVFSEAHELGGAAGVPLNPHPRDASDIWLRPSGL